MVSQGTLAITKTISPTQYLLGPFSPKTSQSAQVSAHGLQSRRATLKSLKRHAKLPRGRT
jgi:hypothetical protein